MGSSDDQCLKHPKRNGFVGPLPQPKSYVESLYDVERKSRSGAGCRGPAEVFPGMAVSRQGDPEAARWWVCVCGWVPGSTMRSRKHGAHDEALSQSILYSNPLVPLGL